MEEIWKDIEGYEGLYEASSFGRIRSLDRVLDSKVRTPQKVKGRILKLGKDTNGYLSIRLHKDKVKTRCLVHRLIAITFCEGYVEKYEVNHINGIKTDNNTNNLEWVTATDNKKHAFRIGLSTPTWGEKSGMSKLRNEQVLEIRSLQGKFTQREISERFNVSAPLISDILNRKIWKHI